MKLFEGKTTNGSSDAYPIDPGLYELVIWGTLDGTIKLQYSPDGGTSWLDETSTTSTGLTEVYLPSGHVRANLSGETSSDVNVNLSGIFVGQPWLKI